MTETKIKHIALVGYGRLGKKFEQILFSKGIKIDVYSDNYLAGTESEGHKIVTVAHMAELYREKKINTIFVAVLSDVEFTQVGIQLLKLSVRAEDIYFVPSWYVNMPDDLVNDIWDDLKSMNSTLPTLNYLDIPVVDWCNLKCKNCWLACNLVKDGAATPREVYERDMYQLTKKFGNIESIHFMGGEPFLSNELDIYIKIAKKCFPRAPLFITTNGSMIEKQSDEILEVIRENDVMISISFYPAVRNRMYDIVKFMENKGLRFWLSPEKKEFFKLFSFDEQDVVKTREACPNTNCHYLQEGHLYGCGVPITMRRLKQIADIKWADEEKGCDIYSNLSGWEMSRILNSPFSTCKHCTADMKAAAWEIAGRNVKIEDYFV